MPAASYDLYIEQGATFRFSMVYGHYDGTLDSSGNDTVIPYDITGCQIRIQIRQRRGSMVLIAATSRNGGVVIDDGPAGKFTVTVSDEATDSLTITKAKYDLEISWPSGDVNRIIQGNVVINPNITQGADPSNISDGLGDQYQIDEMDVEVDTDINTQASTAF